MPGLRTGRKVCCVRGPGAKLLGTLRATLCPAVKNGPPEQPGWQRPLGVLAWQRLLLPSLALQIVIFHSFQKSFHNVLKAQGCCLG